jgi:pyridoxal biosynthesis lyase PdxS
VQANVADEAGAKAAAALQELPPHYREFYARRLISRLAAAGGRQ